MHRSNRSETCQIVLFSPFCPRTREFSPQSPISTARATDLLFTGFAQEALIAAGRLTAGAIWKMLIFGNVNFGAFLSQIRKNPEKLILYSEARNVRFDSFPDDWGLVNGLLLPLVGWAS